jgi:hypothetical protein
MKEGLWDTDAGAFTISALASANGSSDGCSTDAFTSLSTSTIGERCGCLSMRCFCPLFLRRVRDCDIFGRFEYIPMLVAAIKAGHNYEYNIIYSDYV